MGKRTHAKHSKRDVRIHQAVYLATVVLSILFIYFGNRIATSGAWFSQNMDDTLQPVKAKVLEVMDRYDDSYSMDGINTVESVQITFRAEILAGEHKGQVVEATQTNDSFMAQTAKEVEPGDKIVIYYTDEDGADIKWAFGEYYRLDTLMLLGGLFFLFLLVFGHRKGFNTIVSLVFTALAVFVVFIPSILSGYNIYASAIIICIFTIVMTLLIVNGPDRKSLVAAAGCVMGVLVAGGLTLVMDHFLQLTGMVDENSVYLQYLNVERPIDLKAIVFAAITLGALGAIMDVAMSIASSLYELAETGNRPTFRSLAKSGMAIGRDIMGTMSNTLVLAYIGSSLSVVLLLIAYNSNLTELLNKEMIVVEILQTLVGSIGILFTIPLTSLLGAWLYARHKRHSALLSGAERPAATMSEPALEQMEQLEPEPESEPRSDGGSLSGLDWDSWTIR